MKQTRATKRRLNNNVTKRQAPRRARADRIISSPSNKLIPAGVNNRATVPKASQSTMIMGEEVVSIVTAQSDATPGSILFDAQISVASAARLAAMAQLFQRVKWLVMSLHIVTLNGSTTTSGYTAGFIEDPEILPPKDQKELIPFLTGLRGSSVRQNWVATNTGQILTITDLPEMYTQLGQDPRRFYIGRFVAALSGPPGPNTTFQLMLRYKVKFNVPRVPQLSAPGPDPPTPPGQQYEMVFPLNAGQAGINNIPGSERNPVTTPVTTKTINSATPLPPAGEWIVNSRFTYYDRLPQFVFETPIGEGDDQYRFLTAIAALKRVEPLYSLLVSSADRTWADVAYKTSPTSEPKNFPTGAILFGGINDTLNYVTIRSDVPFFLPASVPETAFYDPYSLGGNGWPGAVIFAQEILPAGTKLTKSATFTDEQLNKLTIDRLIAKLSTVSDLNPALLSNE